MIGDAAYRDLCRCGCQKFAHGIDGRRAKAKILRECVGGAQGHDTERYVCSDETLQHFVNGAVAAAGENRIVPVAHGDLGQRFSASGGIGLQCFGIDARLAEQFKSASKRFIALR